MKIENSVALVTGANGGIGKVFIEQLLRADAQKIYACARSVAKLETVISFDPDRVIPIALEVTEPQSVLGAADRCSDVTLLINTAGTSFNQGFIAASDLQLARQEMEINYFGMLSVCRAFAPILKNHGGGGIVNILSLLGKASLPFSGSYSASKAAAISMTQCIRAELAAQNTLVVGVMPGTVNTDLAKDWPDPKVEPEEVVRMSLQALMDGTEDVYPGEQAQQIIAQLQSDPKGVEKYLASFLPGMMLAGTQA